EDVVPFDEGDLQVKLGELRLAVGALVLVAEAAGDLEVTLEAGDHEQLLELLRALRESVELAGMYAAGHQVVARPFRRALKKDGRFNLDKAALAEEITNKFHRAVAQSQVTLQTIPAQI